MASHGICVVLSCTKIVNDKGRDKCKFKFQFYFVEMNFTRCGLSCWGEEVFFVDLREYCCKMECIFYQNYINLNFYKINLINQTTKIGLFETFLKEVFLAFIFHIIAITLILYYDCYRIGII